MTVSDIPFGLSLSTQAGWNQTEADWQVILSTGENAGYVAIYEGQPAATLTTISYPTNILWVGMVLVLERFRKRGIASRLLEYVMDRVADRFTLYLDATPMGEGLYRKAGFEEVSSLLRMESMDLRAVGMGEICSQRLAAVDLDEITRLDQQVFGCGRDFTISSLHQNNPQLTRVVRDRDDINGFCLGRPGRINHQIGPLVASDLHAAQTLLAGAMADLSGRSVFLDIPKINSDWLGWLRSFGFQDRRTFTRMRYGKHALNTRFQNYFAALGPEFG